MIKLNAMQVLSGSQGESLNLVGSGSTVSKSFGNKQSLGIYAVSLAGEITRKSLFLQGTYFLTCLEGLIRKRVCEYKINPYIDVVRCEGLASPVTVEERTLFFDHRPACREKEHCHERLYVTLDQSKNADLMLAALPDWFKKLESMIHCLGNHGGYGNLYERPLLVGSAENLTTYLKVRDCLNLINLQAREYFCYLQALLKDHDSVHYTGQEEMLRQFFGCFMFRLGQLAYDYTHCGLIAKADEKSKALLVELLDKNGSDLAQQRVYVLKVRYGARNALGVREFSEIFYSVLPLEVALSVDLPDIQIVEKLLVCGAKPSAQYLQTIYEREYSKLAEYPATEIIPLIKMLYQYGLNLYDHVYSSDECFKSETLPVNFYKQVIKLRAMIDNQKDRIRDKDKERDDYVNPPAIFYDEFFSLFDELMTLEKTLNNFEMIKEWLFERIDLNRLRDFEASKETHLHLVAKSSNLDPTNTIKCLKDIIRWGGDPNLKNEEGHNALEVLKQDCGDATK